jgi:hypothetical protein
MFLKPQKNKKDGYESQLNRGIKLQIYHALTELVFSLNIVYLFFEKINI